jgi:hypothetical protein
MKRVTYDAVEDLAVRAVRLGHDIKLYFRHTGELQVFHDGELVLRDPGRSYDVALAKVKQIMMNADPANEANDTVTDKQVRRGKQTRTKAAVKKKTAAKKKGAKK